MDRVRRRPDKREWFAAVDAIDLRIEVGEIFGVLGPNGAGKTTTLKMLSTLLIPSAGEARVFGIDVVKNAREVRRKFGAMLTAERSLYWKLTGRENLEYFAALNHVPPRLTSMRIQYALEAVELSERGDDFVERYSTGMRQRLALARALLADPPLLLLDEPTVGLDPQSAHHLRERILQLKSQGRTVLLTTHYMEEADQLCDRVAIIDHGRLAALGTPAELKRTIPARQVVRLRVDSDSADGQFKRRLATVGSVNDAGEQDDGSLLLVLHCDSGGDAVSAAYNIARETGTRIRNVEVVPVSLEEVFLSLTGRALRE